MDGLKQIACATDFSQASNRAIEMTRYLQEKTGAKVTLIHVLNTAGFAIPGPSDDLETRQREETKALDALVTTFGNGARSTLLEGDPARAIAVYAESNTPDLLIIGSHYYKGMAHMLHDSVSEATLSSVECPILRC